MGINVTRTSAYITNNLAWKECNKSAREQQIKSTLEDHEGGRVESRNVQNIAQEMELHA